MPDIPDIPSYPYPSNAESAPDEETTKPDPKPDNAEEAPENAPQPLETDILDSTHDDR